MSVEWQANSGNKKEEEEEDTEEEGLLRSRWSRGETEDTEEEILRTSKAMHTTKRGGQCNQIVTKNMKKKNQIYLNFEISNLFQNSHFTSVLSGNKQILLEI